MSPFHARIIGCGAHLPQRMLTNADLEAIVDTSDSWIVERTGIRQRHIAADDETTADLGLAAARTALDRAGVEPSAVDLIVVATSTPDNTFPATATRIQAGLGLRPGGIALDVQAVCSGFVYALAVADNFLRLGQASTALVVGAETFSRILDWTDRTTCVLFGDGAGAVVLSRHPGPPQVDVPGILSTHLHADGRHYGSLYVDGGPGSTRTTGSLRMNGREVYRHAVVNLADVVGEALAAHGLDAEAIDWLVPHQANARIIDGTARRLGLPVDRVVVTVDRHANTSAASIPLALAEAVADGRIRPGHLVLLEAMGGGFTWGAALVRF